MSSTARAAALAALLGAGSIRMTAAYAQSAASLAPGMQVVDPAGNPVGTVSAVKGADVVLKTAKHEVQIPASSFTPHEGKLLFGMTAAQVDAAADEAAAKAAAAIAPGAEVYGKGGTLAGTIDSLDDQYVTIKLTSGELVRLARTAIGSNGERVFVGTSVAELKAAASGAETAPAPSGS